MSKAVEIIYSKQNKITHLSADHKETGYLLGLKYATDTTEKVYILSVVKQQVCIYVLKAVLAQVPVK